MTFGQPKTLPYKIADPPSAPPFITGLMIVCMVFCVASGSDNWLDKTALTADKISDLLQARNFTALLALMFTASFAQLSGWVWGFNSFFIWAFGHVLEKRLKWLRYTCLLAFLLVSGWLLVFVLSATNPGGISSGKSYIGPSLLLFGMLGGYFAFLPKRKFEPQNWVRSNTQIFSNQRETPIEERYWISPWLFVTAFVIYQAVLQVALYLGADNIVNQTHVQLLGTIHEAFLGKATADSAPYAFQPLAAILNIGLGTMVASLLPRLAVTLKPKRPGGKLQLEVIQHYQELRTLDMTHDQACEGAAKFAAVPIDTARDWIAKGSAGLKDQDLR